MYLALNQFTYNFTEPNPIGYISTNQINTKYTHNKYRRNCVY